MDLNNIELPASVVADLYRNFLVGENVKTKEAIIPEPVEKKEGEVALKIQTVQGWKSLGSNQRNILVVVDHDKLVHLPDEDLHFLTEILGACRLSLDDVGIVNRNNYKDMPYKELLTHFKSRKVLLFGIDPATFGLPMNFPYFQVQAFHDNSFLYSPSLKNLGNDKLLKSKLWICLKRIFNI